MSEGQERPPSKVTIVPPIINKEEIITSEAEMAVRAGYRADPRGTKPEDYPKNFARKLAKMKKEIRSDFDVSPSVPPNSPNVDPLDPVEA